MATRTTDKKSADKADAFINLRVTDRKGVVHSFKTGIALHSSRRLDSALMSNVELFNAAMKEGRVQASVWVVPTEGEQENIDL